MEKLIKYLLQFGQLNEQQIELIKSKVKERHLKKDEYFSEAGKIPNEVMFLLEGVLRVCYYNSKGDEITKFFVDENHLAADLHNYSYKTPSSEYVQAITDCKMLVFTREVMEELSSTIIIWDDIISKVVQKGLMEKIGKLSPMLAEDAATRYREFLNRFPGLINRIPLSYVASFLGITQSSLSRIRRNT